MEKLKDHLVFSGNRFNLEDVKGLLDSLAIVFIRPAGREVKLLVDKTNRPEKLRASPRLELLFCEQDQRMQ